LNDRKSSTAIGLVSAVNKDVKQENISRHKSKQTGNSNELRSQTLQFGSDHSRSGISTSTNVKMGKNEGRKAEKIWARLQNSFSSQLREDCVEFFGEVRRRLSNMLPLTRSNNTELDLLVERLTAFDTGKKGMSISHTTRIQMS
jgi:hypothetical protein